MRRAQRHKEYSSGMWQCGEFILTACFDAGRIQRQTTTEKKLGKVLLNPKYIKEVSSVKLSKADHPVAYVKKG
jgi:hypothetical protein